MGVWMPQDLYQNPDAFTWGVPQLKDAVSEMEDVHTVDDPGEPALEPDWHNWTSGEEVAFWRTTRGIVYLMGSLYSSVDRTAGALIFTLPVDFRPPDNDYWFCTSQMQRIRIAPNGSVILADPLTHGPGLNQVSLATMHFDTN